MKLSSVQPLRERGVLVSLLIVAAAVSFSCTKKEAPAPGASTLALSQQQAPVAQTVTGNLALRILPEVPTVLTDLRVTYSGGTSGNATYVWQRNSRIIDGANSDMLSKSDFVRGDVIQATVTSGDKSGTVSIVIANAPPKVVSVPFGTETVQAGQDLTVKPAGFDADNDEVGFHYRWSVNGNEMLEDEPVLTADKFKRGDRILLTVTPYDSFGQGEPFVSRELVIPNAAPRITSTPPPMEKGSDYSYQVVAVDPDGDLVTFALAAGPPGMTIGETSGLLAWKLSKADAGAYEIEIVAKDSEGLKSTQKFTLTFSTPIREGESK
jgi:hypothetical protein